MEADPLPRFRLWHDLNGKHLERKYKEAKLFPVETKRVVGPGAGCGPHLTGVAGFEQEPLINVESSKINPAFDWVGSILGVVEFSSTGFRTLSPERAAR